MSVLTCLDSRSRFTCRVLSDTPPWLQLIDKGDVEGVNYLKNSPQCTRLCLPKGNWATCADNTCFNALVIKQPVQRANICSEVTDCVSKHLHCAAAA